MLTTLNVAYYCFPCTILPATPQDRPCAPGDGRTCAVRGSGALYKTSVDAYCSCHFLPGSSLLALLGTGMEWISSAPGLGCTHQFL